MSDFERFVTAWAASIGVDKSLTSPELCAVTHSDMRDLLREIATTSIGVSPRRLGALLKGWKGQSYAGRRLVQRGRAGGGLVRWCVIVF